MNVRLVQVVVINMLIAPIPQLDHTHANVKMVSLEMAPIVKISMNVQGTILVTPTQHVTIPLEGIIVHASRIMLVMAHSAMKSVQHQ